MKLSPQKQYLYDLLKDGNWVCSNHIDPNIIRDYRKRISEMLREGFTIRSEVCDMSCGINHKARVHRYKLEGVPMKTVKTIDNDALPPIKVDGRWVPQPIHRVELVPV